MSAHRPIDTASAEAAAPDLAAALAEAPFMPSRKTEGWTSLKQRQFLELVALGHSVETAAHMVQLSYQSAYAFRASARGAVFALGWRAALLLARDRLADTLLTRAFEGQTVTITRDDGSQVERHFHDTRLALATLTRLDRLADADAPGTGAAVAPGSHQAARLAAQEWNGFLDLIEGEGGPARAALFLARRSGADGDAALALEPIAALARADLRLRTGAGDAAEIDIADLDPACRADWTAAQWARAEAAGLLRLAPPPAPAVVEGAGNPQPPQHSAGRQAAGRHSDAAVDLAALTVWWEEDAEEWRTDFPPRTGFEGAEWGEFGQETYCRTLDDDEAAVVQTQEELELADDLATGSAQRDAWLVAAQVELAGMLADRGLPPDWPAAAGGG